MAITLYHDTPSSNSDRVKIALAEKGLSWDGVRVRLANREQKKAEFLQLNPYGKIPVLVEDGKVLFESCIINEYLDEKYPNPPLMPKGSLPARPWPRAGGLRAEFCARTLLGVARRDA